MYSEYGALNFALGARVGAPSWSLCWSLGVCLRDRGDRGALRRGKRVLVSVGSANRYHV